MSSSPGTNGVAPPAGSLFSSFLSVPLSSLKVAPPDFLVAFGGGGSSSVALKHCILVLAANSLDTQLLAEVSWAAVTSGVIPVLGVVSSVGSSPPAVAGKGSVPLPTVAAWQ